MVCVLQSKLPRSSAVFQLYCQMFFFFFFCCFVFFFLPLKVSTIYTSYCFDKAERLLLNVSQVASQIYFGVSVVLRFILGHTVSVHVW